MTNPKDFDQLRTLVSQIEARLSHLETSPFDLRKRSITNLPTAVNPSDGVPLSQVQSLIQNIKTASVIQNFTGSGAAALQIGLAYNSATQSIPNSTITALTFNTNIRDTGIHSVSVNPTRFTAPFDGTYLFFAQTHWTANAGGVRRATYSYLNGGLSTPTFEDNISIPTNNIDVNNHIVGILPLVAGDYLEFRVSQDSGGSLNTGAGFNIAGMWRIGS